MLQAWRSFANDSWLGAHGIILANDSVTGCGRAAWEYEQSMRLQCINDADFEKKRYLEGLRQTCRNRNRQCRQSATCLARVKAECHAEAAAQQQRFVQRKQGCNDVFRAYQDRCRQGSRSATRPRPRDNGRAGPGLIPGRGLI